MARENKKGTSLLGLGLEPEEEKWLKDYAKQKDISLKQLLRALIRKHKKEVIQSKSIQL